jgi:hypothetical protein
MKATNCLLLAPVIALAFGSCALHREPTAKGVRTTALVSQSVDSVWGTLLPSLEGNPTYQIRTRDKSNGVIEFDHAPSDPWLSVRLGGMLGWDKPVQGREYFVYNNNKPLLPRNLLIRTTVSTKSEGGQTRVRVRCLFFLSKPIDVEFPGVLIGHSQPLEPAAVSFTNERPYVELDDNHFGTPSYGQSTGRMEASILRLVVLAGR